MTQITILSLWITAGIATAAVVPDREGSRFGWAPVSVFFGPLWLFVALERRHANDQAPLPWRQSSSMGPRNRVEIS